MFTIGEFARAGRVSVRMLRHYDAIGLLRPARVDDATGYRYYGVDQLGRLNQIVALKDLGFSLQDVGDMADDDVDVAHLRRMFEARQDELREQIEADTARLAGIEARLRTIESENQMITDTITITEVASIRVAELQAVADSWEPVSITPVIRPLCDDLYGRLAAAGVAPVGNLIAHYEPTEDGSSVIVHAAVPVAVDPSEDHDFAVLDLPKITAATAVHHGSMDSCLVTYQAIARWVEANGHRASNLGREVYLTYGEGDVDTWTTDLQIPLIA